MIPLLLSVTFGIGVYLLFEALTNPSPPARAWRWAGLEDLLVRAGLQGVAVRDFALFALASGLTCGIAAQLVLGWPVVSGLAFGLGLGAPVIYYLDRADRRRAAIQVALVDAIAQLRDSIRTGLSVSEGLAALARHGPAVLRPDFTLVARETHLIGFPAALGGLRERLVDPVADVMVASLLLNDRLGGRNVSQLLDQLAVATRAQLRVQEELRANQARNILSARIIAAVPIFILLGVRGIDPDYLTVFNTFEGQLILAGCVASIVVGYAAMLWTARLPDEPRMPS